MKKVLFLIHTLGGGGAEKVLVNLANGMDKSKFDVTVMTVINTGVYIDALNSDVKYKYIFNIPFSNKKTPSNTNNKKSESGSLLGNTSNIKKAMAKIYSLAWKYMPIKYIYKYIIKEKYDIEIAFLEGICAKIISNSNNNDSKKISWIHVDLINQTKSEAIFKNKEDERKCYSKFDEIVCVSETVKSQFINKYKIDENVVVKYNTIDSNEVITKSYEKVDDINKPDKFLMCSIGRLNSQKGYDRLLRVHKNLIDRGIDYELWIIGEGNKKEELQQYIQLNNLSNSVKLLGFKKNPYKYLKLADAFVCSSRAEGFSTVASEAIILGKPIVTVNCSGMKELLGTNNEYGIVTDNTESDLEQGMFTMITNKEVYSKYVKMASMRSKMFNLKESILNIEDMCIK